MGRIGWGVVHIVTAIITAPASVSAAAFTGGYLVADFFRETFNPPTWDVDHSDVERLDQLLADLVDRYPAPQGGNTPSSAGMLSRRVR